MKITLWNKKFSMIYEFVTAKKGDDFVGFRADNKKIEINLPIGYEISEDQLSLISENELRKKITELVFVIAEFKEKKEGSFQSFVVTKNNKKCNFPISACLYLIKDYFQNGYYKTFFSDEAKTRCGFTDEELEAATDELIEKRYLVENGSTYEFYEVPLTEKPEEKERKLTALDF